MTRANEDARRSHFNCAKNMKPKILIIGAGIGGLTSAIALRRAKFDVEVSDEANHAMKPDSPEQALFVAPLGHGEELRRRRVPQFPHRARESLDGHPPTLRQSDDTQF